MLVKPRFLIIGMLMLAVLAACAPRETPSAEPPAAPSPEGAQTELLISAAASLTDALTELKQAFAAEHPEIALVFNFSSSGKLARQIEQGAPSDLFLSASQAEMDVLAEKGLIDPQSRVEFARNRLVLIAPEDGALSYTSVEQINPEEFHYLAIGDPKSVPAGRYAREVLQASGLWEAVQKTLVFGSDVRQVLTFVETGNADLAIVYASDAAVAQHVKVLATIPEELHQPVVYPAAIVSQSLQRRQAALFLAYLTSEKGMAILGKYGLR